MAQQSLSDEEFHRMQMQLIEMRTENYKLKDENKKNAIKVKQLSERETKLDKELNKQIKMKKALSTLNKSKQAQEYEALLQQTEQEFALQNQTLMAELGKLSGEVDKLEKENQQMKRESGSVVMNSDSESELRHLQAENKVLKNNIETLNLQREEAASKETLLSTSPRSHPQQEPHSSEVNDPLRNDTLPSLDGSILSDEKLLHAEAECERLKGQLKELQDVKVELETEREEKSLVEKALSEAESRYSREHRALEGEVDAFREKFERKQAVCLELQHEKDRAAQQLSAKSSEIESWKASYSVEQEENEAQLKSEINSLGKALQSAHNLVERHQADASNLQSQLQAGEQLRSSIVGENNQLKEMLKIAQEKERSRESEKYEQSSHQRALEDRVKQLETELERLSTERSDAVAKFEENARASGALLKQVNHLETLNDNLRRDCNEAKELAEKRKKVMDKQAVESQELSARFTEQIAALKLEHQGAVKQNRDLNEEKIQLLESTCKKQEQELIRINHQDRAKTRELDSCQQQVRDMQASMTSLESSRGWFERALRDAEEVAAKKEEEHQRALEQIKIECKKEVDRITLELKSKDDVIGDCDRKVAVANEEASKRDGTIESLRQQIQDEVNKQKLIEKKGHTSMKDLKRQLNSEKRRNEKLQEKLKEFSANNSNLDELLQVNDDKDGDGSSTSSFSFRDFISPNKNSANDNGSQASSAGHSSVKKSPSPNVSKGETRELLSRITNLQQEKWNLEEQVKHLEESAAGMAEELLEKTKLMQDYVQHTRTDHHKQRAPNEELAGSSKKFSDRMKNMITGQPGTDVSNILELNRKLTRMLEEEMTKNMALKEHLAILSEQLANTK